MNAAVERRSDRTTTQTTVQTPAQPDVPAVTPPRDPAVTTVTTVEKPNQNVQQPIVPVRTEVQASLPEATPAAQPDTKYESLISRMVAENTEMGVAHGKLLAPSAAIYVGAKAAENVNAVGAVIEGAGFLSGLMGLKSIFSRIAFGRKAENAARSYVSINAERGWGPLGVVQKILTAPARFLGNAIYKGPYFAEAAKYAGEAGKTRLNSLAGERAIDLAARGAASQSIIQSAEIMAPVGMKVTENLPQLKVAGEGGRAIYENVRTKLGNEDQKVWHDTMKARAQAIEDAAWVTSRIGHIAGNNILVAAAAWTWNAMGRSFGIFEKGWDKFTSFTKSVATKAGEIMGGAAKTAGDWWNGANKSLQGAFASR